MFDADSHRRLCCISKNPYYTRIRGKKSAAKVLCITCLYGALPGMVPHALSQFHNLLIIFYCVIAGVSMRRHLLQRWWSVEKVLKYFYWKKLCSITRHGLWKWDLYWARLNSPKKQKWQYGRVHARAEPRRRQYKIFFIIDYVILRATTILMRSQILKSILLSLYTYMVDLTKEYH